MKTSISLVLGKRMGCESWSEIAGIVKQAGFDGIDLNLCAVHANVPVLDKLQQYAQAQADAAKAVVDVFAGQPYLTPT